MKTFTNIAWLFCVIASVIIASGCSGPKQASDPEYDVYNALLNDSFRDLDTGVITTVIFAEDTFIVDRENFSERLSSWAIGLPSVEESTLRSFESRNRTSVPLQDKFDVPIPITFISKEKLDALRARAMDGKRLWQILENEYPGSVGVISLSRVGFNITGTQALLYVESARGGLGGTGTLVLLVLEEGKWIDKESTRLWVS